MKRLGIIALLWVFLALPAFASMVSFLIVEEGSGAPANNYSAVWEDELMGAFFDAGHIVSNSPILRVESLSDSELPVEVNADYDEAYYGGADYFILAVLEFRPQNGQSRLNSVVIKIFTTNSQTLIYERRFAAGTGQNASELARAKETAQIVAAQIQ
ncbi:MAG: hypothetical protein LBI14_06640 [Treponema sp.]|jgi:hypothetical protein|nr:hypothetical protein [Treponema sp.]